MWSSDVDQVRSDHESHREDRDSVHSGEEVRDQEHVPFKRLALFVEDRVNVDWNRVAHHRDAEEQVQARISGPTDELLRLGDEPSCHAPTVGPLPDGSLEVQPEEEDEPRADRLARRDREGDAGQVAPSAIDQRQEERNLDWNRQDERDQYGVDERQEHVEPRRVVRVVQDLDEVDHGSSSSYPVWVIKGGVVSSFSAT